MNNDYNYRLLLDFDALFDTRMGTLLKLDPTIADGFDLKAYRGRTLDDFERITGGRITQSAFQSAYASRDVDTLKNSLVTGILPLIVEYIDSLKERIFRKMDVTFIGVDVNIWPYSLAAPVINEYRDIITGLLPAHVDRVRMVRISPDELEASVFSSIYNGWVTYDFNAWISKHLNGIIETPAKGTTVILPKLFVKDPEQYYGEKGLTEEAIRESDKHGLFALLMADILTLEYLSAAHFSFVVPGSYKTTQSSESSSLTAVPSDDAKSS